MLYVGTLTLTAAAEPLLRETLAVCEVEVQQQAGGAATEKAKSAKHELFVALLRLGRCLNSQRKFVEAEGFLERAVNVISKLVRKLLSSMQGSR